MLHNRSSVVFINLMSKKGYLSFFIAIFLLLVVIVLNYYSFSRMRQYTTRVEHTQDVITAFQTLSNQLKSAQIYSPALEPLAREYYEMYKNERDDIITQVYTLKRQVNDNPEQMVRVDTLAEIIKRNLGVLLKKSAAELVQTERGRIDDLHRINVLIQKGIQHEQALLTERKAVQEESRRQTALFIILFSLIAFSLIAWSAVTGLVQIRKRRWLEGFLESVLNSTRNGIITGMAVRDKNKITGFRTEFANASVKKLLGIAPDALTGKTLEEAIPALHEKGVFERFVSVAETGLQDEFELQYDLPDASRCFYVLLSRMGDGVTATLHDITDLKNYEQQLKEKISQLEHSNTELEQYAYAASHDLQEPLRKIRTFASFLNDHEKGGLSEKGQTYMGKISQSAERMSVLIRDLLSFSGMKKEAAFVPLDLNQVVAQVLQDLDLVITQKGAAITLETLPTLSAIPLQMTQLFYNLLNNALKFSRNDTPPLVRVSSRSLDKEETQALDLNEGMAYCEIRVQDNGIGFDLKFADQIFGLFKRLGDVQGTPGSGIGLAICRKVVENHHGLIYANSRPGEGATFHIVLPLQQPARNGGVKAAPEQAP